MAPDVGAVRQLLEELRAVSYAAAERELAELRAFARAHGETAELTHWDVAFWAERLREQRYAYTEEELRPYFPLPAVLDGLFALAQRLFGVRDPRRRRRGAGLAPRRALLPRRRRARASRSRRSTSTPTRGRPRSAAARGWTTASAAAACSPTARPRAPAGRPPRLQPDAAGRRQAVADDVSAKSRRCSTSSATACSTC